MPVSRQRKQFKAKARHNRTQLFQQRGSAQIKQVREYVSKIQEAAALRNLNLTATETDFANTQAVELNAMQLSQA